MTLAEANVKFSSTGSDQVLNSVNKIGSALESNAAKVRSFTSSIASTAIGTAIGNWITDLPNKFLNLGKEMFNASVEAESMNARMMAMSKNAAEAGREIALIRNIALVSPITTKDTYSYALALKSVGFNLQFALPLLAKMAAAKGPSPERLQAFTQVMTKLASGIMPDAEQAITAGIPNLKAKLAAAGLQFDAKGGMVASAEKVFAALQKVVQKETGKAMDLASKTTETKLASFEDALNNFYIKGGDVVKKFFTPMIEAATKALDLLSQSGVLTTVLDRMFTTVFGPMTNMAKLFNKQGLTDDGLKKLADALAFISVLPENLKIGFTFLYDVFKYFIDRLKEIFPGKKAPEVPKSLTLKDRFAEMMAGRGFFGQEARAYKPAGQEVMEKQFSLFKGTMLDFLTGSKIGTTVQNVGNMKQGQFPQFGGFTKGDSLGIYNQLKEGQDKLNKNVAKIPESMGPPGIFATLADAEKAKKLKQQKDTNLLDLIVQNTAKANELTLRNMTYGGGQLAAEGVSSVQMANFRTVSSPRINATNDMVRGVKKEVNATIGSNFLNFSPRRS